MEDAFFVSEVHLEHKRDTVDTTIERDSFYTTSFQFELTLKCNEEEGSECRLLSTEATLDGDGDLVVPRKKVKFIRNKRILEGAVNISHAVSTSLALVGLQVWRGALLLADYLAWLAFTSSKPQYHSVVELGAGVGLSSIAALLFNVAKQELIVTDKSDDILAIARHNIESNQVLIATVHHSLTEQCKLRLPISQPHIEYLVIDWLNSHSWRRLNDKLVGSKCTSTQHLEGGKVDKLEEEEGDLETLFVASDVIYDPILTENFFTMLKELLPTDSNNKIVISLEKRINFSLSDLCVKATGYDHFLSMFGTENSEFIGERIDVNDIDQIFTYDRDPLLELWQIKRNSQRQKTNPQSFI
eukprot:TRINITY_DN3563_c0_g1_i2.p1 TRINITY_DN3563_c0_g1~~TRINITY_DN3563_c0_g1_i2.p1  ORF type:complete len:357 (-),score=57.45 TRINITY_DN3563_c0_g1_i2:1112-2182(-)